MTEDELRIRWQAERIADRIGTRWEIETDHSRIALYRILLDELEKVLRTGMDEANRS